MNLITNFFKRKKFFDNNTSLYTVAWKKFIINKLNLFFIVLLFSFTLISILGYLITPDSTPFANKQHLEIALKKPGAKVKFLLIKNNSEIEEQSWLNIMLFGAKPKFDYIPIYNYKFEENKIIVELYTGLQPNDGKIEEFLMEHVVYGSQLNQETTKLNDKSLYLNNQNCIKTNKALQAVIQEQHLQTFTFFLGTDSFGRDVLSQLIIGSRVSLSVGFVSVIISLIIGISLGSIAGFYGGRIDKFIMFLINIVWAIPTLFLVIAITFALGKGFWQIFFAVGLTLWVEIARLVRGLVMSIKEKEYIEAARALGFSDFRIIVKHVLPATVGPIIVVSAANFASAILIESGLSFLGVGIQPPMPSWGSMLRQNYGFLIMEYSYLAVIPGIAIMLLVLSFMIIGNGIRDSLDVKELKIK